MNSSTRFNISNLSSALIGVNFLSYGSALYQNKTIPSPPQDYFEDSFRIPLSKTTVRAKQY